MDITKEITIVVTPEPDGDEGEYWVHTLGMDKFDRPELELRFVFFPWVLEACSRMNKWAEHSIGLQFNDGDIVIHGSNSKFPVEYKVIETDDEFWEEKGRRAMELMPVLPSIKCQECERTVCGKHGEEGIVNLEEAKKRLRPEK